MNVVIAPDVLHLIVGRLSATVPPRVPDLPDEFRCGSCHIGCAVPMVNVSAYESAYVQRGATHEGHHALGARREPVAEVSTAAGWAA